MQIYNTDFLTFKALHLANVDLIITSPPYNIGIDYTKGASSVYGTQSDKLPYKDYLEFSKTWLSKCFSLLKDTGVICVNVPIDTGSGGLKRSLSVDLTILAKKVGFKYKGTIIWNKQSVKNKYSLAFSKNIELILIFSKDNNLPLKSQYKEWINNIWTFVGENPKRVNHPAAFPPEIPRRLIQMFSTTGDMILDPFMGSGTTIAVAQMLNRQAIGIELNPNFFAMAKKRIEDKKL